MSSTEEDANVSGENSVEKFLTSLITSLVVGSILLLLFLVLRGRKLSPRVLNFRHYFSPRTKYANVKHPGYYPGAFSWFWPTVTYSDWKVFRTHGPDAMIFARFQKLCILLFVVLMWTLALLLPINIAADPVDGVTGLAVLSMSNVASESSWLVAHVVVTWLNSFVVYGMITWFFFWFLRPRRRYLAQDWPRAYTMMVKSVRKGSMESDEALARWAARKFPDKHILAAHVVYNAPKLRNLLQERKDLLTQIELLHRKDQLNKTIRPKKVGKKVNAFEFYKEKVRKVRGKIIERQMNPAAHIKTNHYGFITFAEPHLTYNKTMRKSGYIVKPAPEPSNVFWERLSISPISFILRSIPIYIALFLLIIFWAIITVIVAGFTQLESLSELDGFGWLDFINDLPPPVNGFISGFFPTLALMILALIPWMAINLLVGVVQGHDTRSTADRHKLYWYFFFLVFNILLVYTFGTAVLDTLQEIIDDPASVPELLAASLPSTAVFFLQWLVLATFIRAPLRLIRIGHFVVRSLKLMFLAKTPRKRDEAMLPPPMAYPQTIAFDMLVFTITLTFSVLSPLVILFGLLYFLVSYVVDRYNVLYVHIRRYESGGELVCMPIFHCMFAALLLYQLLMAGVLGVKEFIGTTALSPLLIITVVWWIALSIFWHRWAIKGVRPRPQNSLQHLQKGIAKGKGIAHSATMITRKGKDGEKAIVLEKTTPGGIEEGEGVAPTTVEEEIREVEEGRRAKREIEAEALLDRAYVQPELRESTWDFVQAPTVMIGDAEKTLDEPLTDWDAQGRFFLGLAPIRTHRSHRPREGRVSTEGRSLSDEEEAEEESWASGWDNREERRLEEETDYETDGGSSSRATEMDELNAAASREVEESSESEASEISDERKVTPLPK